MAIETLLAVDLLMNLSILLTVQLALGRIHLPSVLKALIVMSLNTAAFLIAKPCLWIKLFTQIFVCILCAVLIIRSTRIQPIFTAAAAIFITTSAAAGTAGILGGMHPSIFLVFVVFAFLLYRRRNPAVQWNITIKVSKNGVSDSFEALIDTGNRLTEHLSALPVLIAEEKAVPHLSEILHTLGTSEIRTLGFGVLGSGGEMACFRPDEIRIYIDGQFISFGPACWIGIFEGIIPGPTQALAPPEFAEYTQEGASNLSASINQLRRISYAIFNRQTVHLRPRGADQARFGLLHRRQ